VDLIAFRVNNSTLNHLKILQNSNILIFIARNSSLNFELVNYGTLPNAAFNAFNCTLTGDELDCSAFGLYYSDVRCAVGTETTKSVGRAEVKNCSISAPIVVGSKSTYNVVFDGNTIDNNAFLRFSGLGGTNHSFVNTSICNNNVADGPREFVSNSDGNWNYSNIGNYEYKNNNGTKKAEDSIKLALRIPWYSYGATIPSGKKRYLQQVASNSNECSLNGVQIKDLFFSFGENTTEDILARTDPIKAIGDVTVLFEFSSAGAWVNTDTYDKGIGCACSAWYRKGQSATKGIFDGSFGGYDVINVAHGGMTDGDLCDIVLIIDKVYYANATGEILK
jgi:hypothetical protein